MRVLSAALGAFLIAAAGGAEEVEPVPVMDAEGLEAAERGLDTLLEGAEDLRGAISSIDTFWNVHGTEEFTLRPDGARVIDVHEAVRIAMERNAQIMVAEEDVEAAVARIAQARSAWFPQVSAAFVATYTDFNERDSSGILGQLLGGGTSGGLGGVGGLGAIGGIGGGTGTASPGLLALQAVGFLISNRLQRSAASALEPDDLTYTQQFSVRQVLYAGGQRAAAIRASEFLARSQEWQKQTVLDALEFEVKQAYYDCILTGALTRVADESVSTFARQLRDAEDMFEVGLISRFEVLRAQTELERRRADRVTARNAYRLALANLRRLLYLPQDAPLAVEPVVPWQPLDTPVDVLIAQANDNRPELRTLEQGIQAAEQQLRRVRGQYLPQVAASAEYRNTDRAGRAVPDGWTVTVGAELDIFVGGRRKAERAEASANQRGLEYQREEVRRLVELEVTAALIQLRDAMAKVHAERSTLELAEEGLRLAELRFQEGVGTQTETLDAELALTTAESQLIQAVRDYAVANAALEKAIGAHWRNAGEPEAPDTDE